MKLPYVLATFLSLSICASSICVQAQQPSERVSIHSHNDYRQRVPFYQAYAAGLGSIEVDVYVSADGKDLLVAHDRSELATAPTIEELYLEPAARMYRRDGGGYQLLVDLKTPATPTLDVLVAKLEPLRAIFDPTVNPDAVRIVISGNRPAPENFDDYPSYIYFDGSVDETYTPAELERVGIMSESFAKYSRWNGKGYMVDEDKRKVEAAIAKAHSMGKQIRFWGTPDGMTAWNIFYRMGVDIINTDKPEKCSAFFSDIESKSFSISHASGGGETKRPLLLDKTTSSFGGFDADSRKLTRPIELYTPTFKSDGAEGRVKNVILLIGDGMGLNAIQAAETVNGGLTMTKLLHTGLQRTQAGEDYTADSAGAGSSIATGQPNRNRHISMSETGESYPSLAEILSQKGWACGVVTNGPISDATPAAFYGHTTERDNSDEITAHLLDGRLTLLVGSDMGILTHRKDGRDLARELAPTYNIVTSTEEIGSGDGKTICIDERLSLPTTEETIGLLAETTGAAIEKLGTAEDGFFLVVEGAKIDYAGHAGSLASAVIETLGFDMAVAEALRFADRNEGTLVIVTADHETGGLTLVDGNAKKGEITALYMTDDHTPAMVPVFAYGAGADNFGGVYPNTEILPKILNLIF